MSVYLIQADLGGPVKIGFTTADSPGARLASLQTSSPVKLEVVGFMKGAGARVEAELHARFAAHRLAGEWFRPSPEIAEAFGASFSPDSATAGERVRKATLTADDLLAITASVGQLTQMQIAEALEPRAAPAALLDAESAAALLAVPKSWVLAEARAGRIPHLRLGRYVRFEAEQLRAWSATHRHGPTR